MAERRLTCTVSPSNLKGLQRLQLFLDCFLTAAAGGCCCFLAWGETAARAAIWMFSPGLAVRSLLPEIPKLRIFECAVYPVPIDSILQGRLVPDTLRRRWLPPVGGIYQPQRLGG